AVTMNRSIRGLRPRDRDAAMASGQGKKNKRSTARWPSRKAGRFATESERPRWGLSVWLDPVILLFSLFSYEIISRRYRVFRGNPGPPALRRSENSEDRTLFCAVFAIFSSRCRSGPGEAG